MNKVLSIALLTIRGAIRSKVVLTLCILLLLIVIGLPLTIEGDGTVAGQVQILLTYTLGLAQILLGLVAVWTGCAAISTDIAERQIHLVLTKPVHTLQLWLGKWLGILALLTVLLAVTGGATYGFLRWSTRASVLSDQQRGKLETEILVARATVRPLPVDLDKPARALLAERREQDQLPADMSSGEAYAGIKEMLRYQANTVGPGYKRRWDFHCPAGARRAKALFLRYSFSSSRGDGQEVAGLWMAGPDTTEAFRKMEPATAGGVYTLTIPASVIGPDGHLTVEYANVNRIPVTVLFNAKDGVQVLYQVGSFEMNLVRVMLMMLAQLAFLAAVGLAAGACFSLPVAAFSASWILLLLSISGYLKSMSTESDFLNHGGSTPVDWYLEIIFKSLNALVQPLKSPDMLNMLANGRLVSWGMTGWSLLIKAGLYAGALALLSAWILNRREVGVPSS